MFSPPQPGASAPAMGGPSTASRTAGGSTASTARATPPGATASAARTASTSRGQHWAALPAAATPLVPSAPAVTAGGAAPAKRESRDRPATDARTDPSAPTAAPRGASSERTLPARRRPASAMATAAAAPPAPVTPSVPSRPPSLTVQRVGGQQESRTPVTSSSAGRPNTRTWRSSPPAARPSTWKHQVLTWDTSC